jgi:hypothetical protein
MPDTRPIIRKKNVICPRCKQEVNPQSPNKLIVGGFSYHKICKAKGGTNANSNNKGSIYNR